MSSINFINCYNNSPVIITDGSVGLRILNEFNMIPDENIRFSSLIYNAEGRKILKKIYGQYLQVACDYSLPILIMTNTRRANRDNIMKSSFRDKNVICDYTNFLREVISEYPCETYIGGMIGCKGDAYTGEGSLSRQEAYDFHSWQIDKFIQAGVDFIYAAIMPVLDEILGMCDAITTQQAKMPYIISLMIRENGTIIDGHKIDTVINTVDNSVKRKPLCYMTNCIHPQVLIKAVKENNIDVIKERFMGIQANAAYMSPEELEQASEIKSSDPIHLADDMYYLHEKYKMKILGGCCGTDESHIREIAKRLKTHS